MQNNQKKKGREVEKKRTFFKTGVIEYRINIKIETPQGVSR